MNTNRTQQTPEITAMEQQGRSIEADRVDRSTDVDLFGARFCWLADVVDFDFVPLAPIGFLDADDPRFCLGRSAASTNPKPSTEVQ